jgi:glycosyltransferase involved in cell wall biosynthesis
LIDLYRSALFGVVPSFAEDWGHGASECLDFWLPVIVSTAPALREAVQGLMPTLSPNDQEGWFAQVRRLTENKADLAELTKSIIEHYQPIESQESWNTIKGAIADYS